MLNEVMYMLVPKMCLMASFYFQRLAWKIYLCIFFSNEHQIDICPSLVISLTFALVLQDISIQGETPLMWPLWLRAAVPGNISLYVVIYYEMGDVSSVMRYRTLRMHYNLQVWTWIWKMEILLWFVFLVFYDLNPNGSLRPYQTSGASNGKYWMDLLLDRNMDTVLYKSVI